MNYLRTNETRRAIAEIEKAHAEIERLLGKDATYDEAMNLLQISNSIKGLKKEVEKSLAEHEASVPEEMIEQFKQNPFQFSEKDTRQYIRRFGKTNMRRLATECEKAAIFGYSWAGVSDYLQYGFTTGNIATSPRLELLAMRLGFNLVTLEPYVAPYSHP